MANLLIETKEAIHESGHLTSDVAYVGTLDGSYRIIWQDFESIADVVYYSGYGAAEVATDLVVRFWDDTYLVRGEYDGSEWWDYQGRPPEVKPTGRPFTKVVGGMWDDIHSLNDPHYYDEEDNYEEN